TKEISSGKLDQLLTTCSTKLKASDKILGNIGNLLDEFEKLKGPMKNYHQDSLIITEEFAGLKNKLQSFSDHLNDWLQENPDSEVFEEMLDYFLNCHSYLKISDFYGPAFKTRLTYDRKTGDLSVKIFCLDPSDLIDEQL